MKCGERRGDLWTWLYVVKVLDLRRYGWLDMQLEWWQQEMWKHFDVNISLHCGCAGEFMIRYYKK
jgi:hypothetical protein